MADPITAPDITDGVSDGEDAANLINDTKRAANEIIPLLTSVVKDWETVTSNDEDLISGIDLTENPFDELRIEFRKGEVRGDGDEMRLVFGLASSEGAGFSSIRRTALAGSNAESLLSFGTSSTYGVLSSSTQPAFTFKGSVELSTTPEAGSLRRLGYSGRLNIQQIADSSASQQAMLSDFAAYSTSSSVDITRMIMKFGSGATNISYQYRVIKP